MKKLHSLTQLFVLALCAPSFIHCGTGDATNTYTNTNRVTVDSTNDRLFLTQSGGDLFAMTASTRQAFGSQPLVSADTNTVINDLMPDVTTNIATYTSGTTSRLFIMGALADSSDNLVLNQIRVLDFDGSTFTEASFSPITLSDGDATTNETDDSFASLLVDQTNAQVFVTDATTGLLFVLDAVTGAQLTAPIAIAGRPQGLALKDNRLYVCNTSLTAAEQVVTVVNVTDFSTTTIDFDMPCNKIAVDSTATGTVMIVRRSDAAQVLIRSVDTTTYATSSVITTSQSGYTSGVLATSYGISSTIHDVVVGHLASGEFHAYLSETDGNLEHVTIDAGLAAYTHETLATAATGMDEGALLKDATGLGSDAFFVSEIGYLVTIEVGSSSADLDN